MEKTANEYSNERILRTSVLDLQYCYSKDRIHTTRFRCDILLKRKCVGWDERLVLSKNFPPDVEHFNISSFLLHFRTDSVYLSWFPLSVSTVFFYLIEAKCRSRKCRTSSMQECIDVSDLHINCLQLLYICIRIEVSGFAFSIKNLHTNWSQENLNPVLLYFGLKSASTINSILGI